MRDALWVPAAGGLLRKLRSTITGRVQIFAAKSRYDSEAPSAATAVVAVWSPVTGWMVRDQAGPSRPPRAGRRRLRAGRRMAAPGSRAVSPKIGLELDLGALVPRSQRPIPHSRRGGDPPRARGSGCHLSTSTAVDRIR